MTDPIPEPAGLHEELREATARLLGDTIGLAEDDWHGPSRLPGWTRGHVATHLARNADALGRLVAGVLSGEPGRMYASDESRDAEIAAGADRDGAALQTDLDTSAAALDHLFATVADTGAWQVPVTLRGGAQVPAATLPVVRLTEVALHHVDLDVGFAVADLPAGTAEVLLDWVARRVGSRFTTAVRLAATDSAVATGDLGPSGAGAPAEVSGSTADLLAWLTGRGTGVPSGADGVEVPAF